MSRAVHLPFSWTAIMAHLQSIPAMGGSMTAPPSSMIQSNRRPFFRKYSSAKGAPLPPISSLQEENRYTLTGKTKPASSSSSMAVNSANSGVLVSTVPHPQSLPSLLSPPKGGSCHSPAASTTSWWDITMTFRVASVPASLYR